MPKPNPIRLGILGLGRAGWGMHCKELEGKERRFQIVAGCDTLKEKRDRFAARYNCPVYRQAEDLVADPNVEMVSVATRSVDHLKHATMALAAGKHAAFVRGGSPDPPRRRECQRAALAAGPETRRAHVL